MDYLTFSLVLLSFNVFQASPSSLPVVMWHGMGDSCCNPLSLGQIKKIIEEHAPGIYVKSLKIGKNIVDDTEHGFFGDVNEQVNDVCQQLAAATKLKDGYNAIGFSQGGQFLRAVAQRCPNPPMKTLITMGGQHQGIFGLPNCGSVKNSLCDYIRRILNVGAYWSWVQKEFVQAEYWHDPLDEETYRNASRFLADINNEVSINKEYIRNLNRLKKLVLVKFNNDTIVLPRETSWFGFYKPGQAAEVVDVHQTRLYTEDRIGLKQLEATGKLEFVGVNGNHLQFSLDWFVKEIILKYLK